MRESVKGDDTKLHNELADLKEQVAVLKEKDRLHLEEIKRFVPKHPGVSPKSLLITLSSLLMEKIELQSSGITQREKAIERERDFGFVLDIFLNSLRLTNKLPLHRDLRAALASGSVPADIQQQVLDAHQRNMELAADVKELNVKLQQAKSVSPIVSASS